MPQHPHSETVQAKLKSGTCTEYYLTPCSCSETRLNAGLSDLHRTLACKVPHRAACCQAYTQRRHPAPVHLRMQKIRPFLLMGCLGRQVTHLESLLYPQAPNLLHEQENAIAPDCYGLLDLIQLECFKVLRRT